MAQASRDENRIPTLLGVSNVDGITPVRIYADPVTHRLLVDLASVAPYTPAGAVNGVNTVYTVLIEPKWVVADGITYFDGAGYTYAALGITMDIPPSSYIRYVA